MNLNDPRVANRIPITLARKLEAFRALIQQQQVEQYKRSFPGYNEDNLKRATSVSVEVGRIYAYVDIGGGGRYMVELSTGNIFGIKAYGQVHRGHFYGTPDTINEWNWGNYYPTKRVGTPLEMETRGCCAGIIPKLTFAPDGNVE